MKINIIEEDHTYSLTFGEKYAQTSFLTEVYGEYDHNWAKGYTLQSGAFVEFCLRNRKQARIKISQEAEVKNLMVDGISYEVLPFEITVKPNGNILELDFSMFD